MRTQAQLPSWQLEPDDQVTFSGRPEDYYLVDDQGNLIEPANHQPGDRPKVPPQDVPVPGGNNGGLVPVPPPPAANDDFLNEATGGGKGANRASDPPPRPN